MNEQNGLDDITLCDDPCKDENETNRERSVSSQEDNIDVGVVNYEEEKESKRLLGQWETIFLLTGVFTAGNIIALPW